MAPRTLARSRAFGGSSWLHPRWYGPEVCYADGGDDDGGAGAVDDTAADDADGGAADDWTPPTRDEYEQLIASKRKADGEAAARRKYLKAHGIDPKTGEKLQADEPDESEPAAKDPQQQGLSQADMKRQVDRAVAEARIEGMRGAKKLVGSFNKALADAGWNGQRLELIMPLVDFEEIDLDDEEDLRERIENVKKVFPEGFKRTRNAASSAKSDGVPGQNGVGGAKVDTADKPAPKPEPKGWAEQLAARALRS